MTWLTKKRAHAVSFAAVLLLWAQGVHFDLTAQDFIREVASSLPRLALYACGHGVVVLTVVALLLALSRERPGDLGFEIEGLSSQLGIGSLFGVGLFLLHAVTAPIIDALIPASSATGVDLVPLFGDIRQYPLLVFLVVFKGGLAEETWRVFGLTRFERLFGVPGLVVAVVLGSIVFGLGHLYQGLDSAIGTGIQGLLFALIYLRKRRALEAVAAHAVYDVVSVSVAYAIF